MAEPDVLDAEALARIKRPRDAFLDVVKCFAIGRVLLWHTFGWWWLSWIPAMPAMFFVAGALLDDSLSRQRPLDVMRSRLRRLLLPFWAYSTCCVALMFSLGWRPELRDLVWWVVPLGDPVGSTAAAGLWIPLWYLRAYLWFLLLSPLLRMLAVRYELRALVAPAVATLGVWLLVEQGVDVPLAIGDLATYSAFVLAGMLYRHGRLADRRAIAQAGAACAVAAVAWVAAFGPASLVVNASYPLVLLVGGAGIAAAVLAAPWLRQPHPAIDRVVRSICGRSVTIYLWHGFGLFAAAELVGDYLHLDGVVDGVAALTIVLLVTALGVWSFGWIEDIAARRQPRLPTVRLAPVMAIAVIVLATAIVAAHQPTAARETLTPSGQAVMARSQLVERSLREAETTTTTVALAQAPATRDERRRHVEDTFTTWVDEHRDLLADVGTHSIEAVVVDAGGHAVPLHWSDDETDPRDPHALVAWWSIAKVVTAAWLADAVDAGQVGLGDPLSLYVPELPFSDAITLEQLARHQAGLPDSSLGLFDADPAQEIATWTAQPWLVGEPGSGFHYSRLDYYFLAWALERATGTSWVDRVHGDAAAARVHLTIDEDVNPYAAPSHPDGGAYRGHLWASGGILATPGESATFLRWLLTEGVSPTGRANMSRFLLDASSWHYGLGLMPLCPCRADGDWLVADRYGLDSAAGSFGFDPASSATVFLAPSRWFASSGPVVEFYELESRLLDAAR